LNILKIQIIKNQKPEGKSTSRKSIGKQKKGEISLNSNFYDPTQLAFRLFDKKLDETKQVKMTSFRNL